jgi:hypothetical protein
LGRICVGTFWGRIYWARDVHEETASLPLETFGKEGRGATVAEALELAMGPSLKFCSRASGRKSPAVIVTLWVAGKKQRHVTVGRRLTNYGILFVS